MAEQTINADFNLITGATAASVSVRIRRMEIFGVSGEVVLGGNHTVTADVDGLAAFALEPGGYLIEYESNAGQIRAAFTVGTSGPYDLGDLITNQAIPVTPTVLQQALAAASAAAASAATAIGVNWRDDWVTSTSYAINDAVSSSGTSYIATTAHTSGAATQPGVGLNWQDNWGILAASGSGITPGPGFAIVGSEIRYNLTSLTKG